MILLNILLISLFMVFVLDYTDFKEEIEKKLKRIMKNPTVRIGKPFACSLCMTFWTGLIYLMIVGAFSLPNIGFICLCAMLTPEWLRLMYLIRGIIEKIIILGEKLFRI